MKWKRLGYLLGIAISTILGIVPASPVHAQSIELPIDFTVNFKNYLNVKNGIAGLDGNGTVTSPISGDLTNGTFLSPNNTKRLLKDRFSDIINLLDYGADLSQSNSNIDSITAALATVPSGSTVYLPCGSWWPKEQNADGSPVYPNTTNWYVFDATACPMKSYDSWPSPSTFNSFIGDGNIFQYNNAHGKYFRRKDMTFNGYPFLNIIYESDINASAVTGTSVFRIQSSNGSKFTDANNIKNHLNVGIDLNLDDYRNDAGADGVTGDTAQVVRMNRFLPGSNSWAFSFELDDWSGHRPTAMFSQANEIDQKGNGYDNDASQYDPRSSHRWMLYFSPTTRTGGWSMRPYSASTHYAVGDMVIEPVNSVNYVFICTTAGTTAATAPAWSSVAGENSTLQDGTVTWTTGSTEQETVGIGIWFNQNTGDNASFNTGISGNQTFNNAFIDTTQMNFPNSSSAVIRLGENQYVDWSGKNLNVLRTDTGRNTRLMGYSSSGANLSYSVSGTPIAKFFDDGMVGFAFQSVTAAGTTISDATATTASTVVITSSTASEGVHVSSRIVTPGMNQTFVNTTSNPVNVYPIDNGWAFKGYSAGTPIVLQGKSKITVYGLNYGQWNQNLIGVSYDTSTYAGTVTYASLPTVGKYVGEAYYCTDCYSKLREDGDTQTGIVLYWNGTSFRDALGINFNHP